MPELRSFHPEDESLLGSPAWARCEALIKAFETAWQRGPAPPIADFLHADGQERRALLVELVHVDLEFRLKAGQPVRVESYFEEFAELSEDRRLAEELIAAEVELRRRLQNEGADELRRRSPGGIDDLSERVTTIEGLAPRTAGDESRAAWPSVPGYEIIERIGRGGMGVVYRAREPSLGREVALKFLPAEYASDPGRLERFIREARTASALNHPNICTVHALGEHDGRPFIVMEFIEGRTLFALLEGRPPLDETIRLVRQAARALAAAHAAGVVHRDIKPDNVMVRPDGWVKVLDFGLARRPPRLTEASSPAGRDTDPGALVGTAAYMSPEQARGETVEHPSDIFSLGIVLYQLVTGRHPFEADSPLGMLQAIGSRQPPRASRLNPEIGAHLDGLIEAMLHKDARLRPSAAQVEETLLAAHGAKAARPGGAARPVVHREPELAVLRDAWSGADAGRGSFICIAGEPGIGKTTLVDDFLQTLAVSAGIYRAARGHCSERLGGSEAYLPVVDALGDLLRGDATGSVARLMQVVAPTWYGRLAPTAPAAAAEAAAVPRAASQPAMLREFCCLLEETARLTPIVFFFDDVHWADVATVDLLAHLGRQCESLRVLVVATYRPTEMLLGPHPFHAVKLELQGKRVCTDLQLGFLGRGDIDRYLTLAFPGHAFTDDFADLIHLRTEGSPLFMADLLRYLRERGVVAQTEGRWSLARELPDLRRELPESVRSMIQRKLERLSEGDRRLLAAASVQGQEFDAAIVADALGIDPADVEERLQDLDRVHGLVRQMREHELPDRTLTLRCVFVHALYQQALYAELPPSKRAALSRTVAQALERHHGAHREAIAAELARLHEAGRDFAAAAQQFCRAARNAASIFAHHEAIALARRGLHLLDALPDSVERAALELPLQTTLGLQLQVIDGYAAPAAQPAYQRARALCPSDDAASLFPVLWGLWLFHKVRSELHRAGDLAEALLELARRLQDPALALQAHQALGITALCRGEPAAALRHVEQVASLYNPQRHGAHAFLFGQDPGVICKAFGAVALWLLGFPDAAQRESSAAIDMSRALSPNSRAVALHFAAMVHQLRRDPRRVHTCAEAARTIAIEHGFSFWRAGSAILSGWALAAQGGADEGIARLRQGLADWQATGSVTYRTYYLGLLAETLAAHGRADEATSVLDDALQLAADTSETFYVAELRRLRGERRGVTQPSRAEAELRTALELARQQDAKSLELRAALSLARLAQRERCADDAQALLRHTYAYFSEGHQTPDLAEARALLAAAT